jgi:hypothetical protein
VYASSAELQAPADGGVIVTNRGEVDNSRYCAEKESMAVERLHQRRGEAACRELFSMAFDSPSRFDFPHNFCENKLLPEDH